METNSEQEETFQDTLEETPIKTVGTSRNQGRVKALTKLSRALEKATYQQGLIEEST